MRYPLALFIQEVEQRCGLLADQVDAARIVDVVDVSPADALYSIFLLQVHKMQRESSALFNNTVGPRVLM